MCVYVSIGKWVYKLLHKCGCLHFKSLLFYPFDKFCSQFSTSICKTSVSYSTLIELIRACNNFHINFHSIRETHTRIQVKMSKVLKKTAVKVDWSHFSLQWNTKLLRGKWENVEYTSTISIIFRHVCCFGVHLIQHVRFLVSLSKHEMM